MSAVNPSTPSPGSQKAQSAEPPKPPKPPSAGGGAHIWGKMTFSAKEWHMFMKTIEQNVALQIKRENSQWKRANRRMRRMWSGG